MRRPFPWAPSEEEPYPFPKQGISPLVCTTVPRWVTTDKGPLIQSLASILTKRLCAAIMQVVRTASPVGLPQTISSPRLALKPIIVTQRRFNLSLTNNFKHLGDSAVARLLTAEYLQYNDLLHS